MTTYRIVTSIHALVALMVLPSTLGYATSATPISKPAVTPTIRHEFPTKISSKQKPTYDLGLGKNAPLSTKRQTHFQADNVMDASRFWVAPEPAVTYPSPHSVESTDAPKSFTSATDPSQKVSKKSIRKSIPVHLKRQSEDDLQISNGGIIIPRSHDRAAARLDLNTVWVEALIHNQQMQLALAN